MEQAVGMLETLVESGAVPPEERFDIVFIDIFDERNLCPAAFYSDAFLAAIAHTERTMPPYPNKQQGTDHSKKTKAQLHNTKGFLVRISSLPIIN